MKTGVKVLLALLVLGALGGAVAVFLRRRAALQIGTVDTLVAEGSPDQRPPPPVERRTPAPRTTARTRTTDNTATKA